MVQYQLLSYVLQEQDDSILTDNQITKEYFSQYSAEYEFIAEHKEKYGNVPDRETFQEHFPTFEILEVHESTRYLVDTIREEYLYSVSVPVANKFAELLKSDANAAAEYLKKQSAILQPNYSISGIDITKQSNIRYQEYTDRKDNPRQWYFESGFPELDTEIDGFKRKEEFVVIVARLGQGKSFFLISIAGSIWKQGFNVGYVSPEMSYNSIGFRFDTLLGHFSNRNLLHGENVDNYEEYIKELQKKENKFVVVTPADFGKQITISKLRNFVKQYELDALFIDGIKYLRDERAQKGDTQNISLTNISEDLMELSNELEIPVFTVVQSNRAGASNGDDDNAPTDANIRDSDGIGHNASKILSLKQVDNGDLGKILQIRVPKNRDGKAGGRVDYLWDVDIGNYKNIPIAEKPKSRRVENSHKDSKEVF